MRSIWKGSLTFGLVNVPVRLYSATDSHDVSFHQVHGKDGGRIHYQRKCEKCEKVVSYGDIDKEYESDSGKTAILTAEDFQSLPSEKSHEIEVMAFVPTEQIDPVYFNKSYYLEPDSKSPKAYVLLRRTLEQTDRTAVVKFALRQRTHLAALRVKGDVLVIQTLLWGDELRKAEFASLDGDVRIQKKELEMSSSLVENFSSDFDPDEYTDEYQEQLQDLVKKKLKGAKPAEEEAPADEGEDAEVLDLMAALEASVKETSAKKGKKQPARKSKRDKTA
ncbi:Ku protein [Saxibacter everestensis]|uniref:Non-homologous end joining protein Ku n=1 Tax=Saxibacter everestensis TaxID=2909229 RepID=A0ABY8QWN4_9MICO|nr:Ku protein [Brevibacteriaceae bacterium ZFBP1038]